MSAVHAPALLSPSQAAPHIADVFQADRECTLSVCEERAFKRQWLDVGTISLVASRQSDVKPVTLIRHGAYEWQLPELDSAVAAASALLGLSKKDDNRRVFQALDELASIATRIGCTHPRFDPVAVGQMPFRRSTTIVVDTSGVLQGALDFVARFLHPAARVKVPAITQMEIANQGDRFLSIRRSQRTTSSVRSQELLEHLKSQGGQRALLRVELHADVEVERTYLLGDPLRSAFSQDREADVRDLNISSPIRSYADRLIVEAARHHQAQSGPAHVVRLLTGDQGQARMALAEGIRPLFFTAATASDVFGHRLAGQTFDPFSGHIREVPLTDLVWELATAFGSARLKSDSATTFQVTAIGDGLSWAPYHAEQDLLWCSHEESSPSSVAPKPTPVAVPDQRPPDTSMRDDVASTNRPAAARPAFLRFNVARLFRLVCVLDDLVQVPIAQVNEIAGASVSEYRRFLETGGFVTLGQNTWTAHRATAVLSAALRNRRIEEIKESLRQVPSFAAFAVRLGSIPVGEPFDLTELGRGAPTYRALGEVTLLCASISHRTVYSTPNVPELDAFARIAANRFHMLDRDYDGLVATGEWLEALIREDGIHPEVARQQLDACSEAGLLRRSTEGSTPQLRFSDHYVHVLRVDTGLPTVERASLYRGDYLIPGKASVSLRIEGPTQ